MNTRQVIAIVAIAFTGTAALADDITIVNDSFSSTKSRAEVKAEVLRAHAAGVTQFATEADATVGAAAPVAKSALTREQVRAELKNAPRQRNASFNEAA
jgi:hypothetical protein